MTRLTGALASICVLSTFGSTVHADVELIDASGLEYFINTDTSATTSSASGAASEASYTTAVPTTTSGGGTTTVTLTDAFDGYGALVVNGEVFTDNGEGTLVCGDREVAFGTQTIGDLEVTRRAFVPDDDEFLRWLNIVTNTGSADVDVRVSTLNNLGSDSDTEITATSNGNLIQEVSDLWIATGGDFDDPRLGHILQGAGAPLTLAAIDGFDENNPEWEYESFTLPAGDTAIVMFIVSGQPTNAAAAEKATSIAALEGSLIDCMTNDEASQVLNFIIERCDVDADCDDGNVCTGMETCVDNICVQGDPLVCPGGEECDPVTGCPGGMGGSGGEGGTGGSGATGGSAGSGGTGGTGGSDGGGGGCSVGTASTHHATGILFTIFALLTVRRRRTQ